MKRNVCKGSILLFLSFYGFFTFIFVSHFPTFTRAAGGCVAVRVQYLDGCPRPGASVRTTEGYEFGDTNESGWTPCEHLAGPKTYYVYANWPYDTYFAGPVDLDVDENGNGFTTIQKNVEITPPTISILSPQNSTYTNSSVPLTFTIYDYSSISWIGYSLDGQASMTVAGNTTLSGLSYGCHDVVVYANDTFGNMGASNKIFFSIAIIVPDHYTTIQEAINNANDGDTIFVRNGTYYENVVVNKTVSLIGENREATIIDASGIGNATRVVANNVTIMGFTLSSDPTFCGVLIEIRNNTHILNNNIKNNLYGIGLWYSFNNIISGNNIENNYNGIRIKHYSRNNTITENNIRNNDYGVWTWWSSNNTLYHNNFINNTYQAHVQEIGYPNSWDDGYPSGGNYWNDYIGTDLNNGPDQNLTGSDGIGDTAYIIDSNNQDHYPLMKPYPWASHDIGITSVTTSKTIVGQGYNVSISIMTFNYGNYTENINITIYANTTIIGEINNIDLLSKNFTIVQYTWNTTGFAKGNYTIKAIADTLLGEIDLEDNTFIDGWVLVTIPGDVNGDGMVFWQDLLEVLVNYGKTVPPAPPNTDINNDHQIFWQDLLTVLVNYGQTDP